MNSRDFVKNPFQHFSCSQYVLDDVDVWVEKGNLHCLYIGTEVGDLPSEIGSRLAAGASSGGYTASSEWFLNRQIDKACRKYYQDKMMSRMFAKIR